MKIAIVGMGLIGGSLGRAILKYTQHTVYGVDSDENALIKADLLGAQTAPLDQDKWGEMDMVIIALAPTATLEVMGEICPKLKDGAIVADTCGNKRVVVAKMQQLQSQYSELYFVGVHPMAGREYSGISHSSAGLFERAYFIIVPVSCDIEKLASVKALFMSLGAQDVEICSAQKHDEMISYTSQLAHIVSSSYVMNPHSSEHAGFSAGSFRDLTRVAKLNPDMWTELFLQNKDNLIGDIDLLIARLQEYRGAIAEGDSGRLHDLLAQGVEMKECAETARKERLK